MPGQFEEIGGVSVGIRGDYSSLASDFDAALRLASGFASRFTSAIGSAVPSLDSLSSGFLKTGAALTAGLTVPIAGLAVAMASGIDDFRKFELSMRQVTSLMGNVSQQEFKALSDATLELSTRLGVDAVKAAKGLYEAISAGVPKENAITFLEVATKTAIAGVTNTKVAVDGLTTVLNAFQLSTSKTKEVADAMFMAVNLGKFTFEQLAASMSKAMPIAAQVGVSFKEVLAAAATLTKQGVPVSEAMTQISRAITSLIAPSKEMKEIFEKIGVESGKVLLQQRGLEGALQAVRDATGGVEGDMFKAMRRMEGFRALLGLTGENAKVAAEDLAKVTNSTGAMDLAFKEIEKSGARGFDALKVAMTNLSIEAAEVLAPAIAKIITNLKPMIEGLMDAVKWFASLNPEVQKAALIMATMAAAAGPLSLMVGGLLRLREAAILLAPSIVSVTGALNLLSKVPYVALIASLVALAKATYDWKDARDSMHQSEQQQIDGLAKLEITLRQQGVNIKELSDQYNHGLIGQTEYIRGLQKLAKEHGDAIPKIVATAKGVKDMGDGAADASGKVGALAQPVKDVGVAAGEARTSIDDFMTAWDRLHTEALPTAEDLDKAMRQVASAAYEMASAIGEIPPEFGSVTLAEIAAQAKQAGISLEVMIPPDLKPKIDEVTTAADRMGEETVKAGTRTKEAMREVRQAINTISEGIANSIIHWKGWGAAAMSTLEAVGKAILKNIIQQLLEATGIVDTLVAGIGKVLAKIGLGAVSGAAGSAASSAAGAGASAAGAGGSLAGGVGKLATGLAIADLGVSVASGIATGIQLAHIESDVAKIEVSTRQTITQLIHIQGTLNQWLPKLDYLLDVWKSIESPNGAIGKIRDILWYGKINVNVVRGEGGTGSANDILNGGFEPALPPGSAGPVVIPGEPSQGFVADSARSLSRGFADFNTAAKVIKESSGYMLKAGEYFGGGTASLAPMTTAQALSAAAARLGTSVEQFKDFADKFYSKLDDNSRRGMSLSDVYQPVFGNTSIFADESTDPNKIAQLKAIRDSLELYRAGNISYAAYVAAVDKATDKYQLQIASIDTLISRFSTLTDASTPEARSLMSLIQAQGGTFSDVGVTRGYQGGGKAVTDLSRFTEAYQAIQQSGFGGTANLGNSSFINPAMMRTGTVSGASEADKSQALAQYSAWLQQFAAERAQQTADALAGMQQLALVQYSTALQAATKGHNIRMDPTGKLWQLDQAGNLIDADTGKVLINAEQLYNQYANPTGVPTGMQGTPDITRENAMGGITRLVANQRAYGASPVDYSALLRDYSGRLNTSWQTQSPADFAGSLFGGPMGGDGSRTIVIQAFDPASRAIGRGLVDELQNNGIYR